MKPTTTSAPRRAALRDLFVRLQAAPDDVETLELLGPLLLQRGQAELVERLVARGRIARGGALSPGADRLARGAFQAPKRVVAPLPARGAGACWALLLGLALVTGLGVAALSAVHWKVRVGMRAVVLRHRAGLRAEDPRLRLAAVHWLRGEGAPLLGSLFDSTEQLAVHEELREALQLWRLRGGDALEALRELAALQDHGAVVNALEHPERAVRHAAAGALAPWRWLPTAQLERVLLAYRREAELRAPLLRVVLAQAQWRWPAGPRSIGLAQLHVARFPPEHERWSDPRSYYERYPAAVLGLLVDANDGPPPLARAVERELALLRSVRLVREGDSPCPPALERLLERACDDPRVAAHAERLSLVAWAQKGTWRFLARARRDYAQECQRQLGAEGCRRLRREAERALRFSWVQAPRYPEPDGQWLHERRGLAALPQRWLEAYHRRERDPGARALLERALREVGR
ncbi:MAG: hypothetical protein AB7N76_13745 [Planctomycetota bacterium]